MGKRKFIDNEKKDIFNRVYSLLINIKECKVSLFDSSDADIKKITCEVIGVSVSAGRKIVREVCQTGETKDSVETNVCLIEPNEEPQIKKKNGRPFKEMTDLEMCALRRLIYEFDTIEKRHVTLKRLYEKHWNPQGVRKIGRPKITWKRTDINEAREHGKEWTEVKALAQNRILWRQFVDVLCFPE